VLHTLSRITGEMFLSESRVCGGGLYKLEPKQLARVSAEPLNRHHIDSPLTGFPILKKYRRVDWVFAIYRGIELEAVYYMPVELIEPFFAKWEAKWRQDHKDINNPKIPLKFVPKHGVKVFPTNEAAG
jgi:Restriction endonuclease PvuII